MKKRISITKEFYENGQLESQTPINILTKEKNGIAFTYYKNGKLKSREKFNNNILIYRRVFWPNGKMKEEWFMSKGNWVQKIRNGRGILVSHSIYTMEMLRSYKLSRMVHKSFTFKCMEIDMEIRKHKKTF